MTEQTLFTSVTNYVACENQLFFGQVEAPDCLVHNFPSLATSPVSTLSVIYHNRFPILQLS